MTQEQKIEKILELPHGEQVLEIIYALREAETTTEVRAGSSAKELPYYDELVQGLRVWIGLDS